MTFSTEDKILRGPKCNTPVPDHLVSHIFAKLHHNADKVAQVFPQHGGLQLTFRQLSHRAVQAAAALRRMGLRPGDVLAVATAGCPQLTPLLLGSLVSGVVIAPFNPAFDENEMQYVLGLLRPRVIVAEEENPLYQQNAPFVLHNKDVDAWFTQESDDVDYAAMEVEEVALDSPAVVLCSSGTTGLPKGVEISHRALLQLMAIGTEQGMMLLGDGSFLVLTPVFWVSAIALQLLSINSGCRIVTLTKFDESVFVKTLRECKVMGTLMSPHLGVRLCKMSPQPDLAPLRLLTFGGSALDRATQAELERRFQLSVSQMYGMTELLITLGKDKAIPTPLGSVGKLQPNVEVKVVDTESGDALGPGQDGELCFRGPTVTRGYYRDPAATAAAIDAEGWFHTGDIGHYNEAGYFYITDRIKDLIKYNGHHVSSALLEEALVRHPAVLEAAVIGVIDPKVVEIPMGYVTLKPGAQASEEELVSFVNDDMSEVNRIRGGIVFIDKIPRTATGKANKRLLREMAKKAGEEK